MSRPPTSGPTTPEPPASARTRVTYVDGRPMRMAVRAVTLEVLGPDGEVLRIERAPAERVRIGAGDDVDLHLEDGAVSRHHCEIVPEGDRWLVRDLGSTNGTFVDLVQVREAFLRPGQTLWLGDTRLRFAPRDEEVPLEPADRTRFGGLLGGHPSMRTVYAILERVAPTDTTVLIEGETGTGKDVAARAIHEASPRQRGPLVVFDCGAVPRNLIESELFGHERGAFTGAVAARRGAFEAAHGGTLFLDELGELPTDLQPRLLRALESREVKRVGATAPRPVDVRVVAATNRDLAAEVDAGRFRQDLYYRLGVVRLVLPPLRERLDDVPGLVEHVLETARFNRGPDGRPIVREVSRAALERLLAHEWPGNVRELVHAVERAVRFSDGPVLEARALPLHVVAGDAGGPGVLAAGEIPFKEAKERFVARFERAYVESLLDRHAGNLSHAAREAELDRKHLRRLAQKHGLRSPDGDG